MNSGLRSGPSMGHKWGTGRGSPGHWGPPRPSQKPARAPILCDSQADSLGATRGSHRGGLDRTGRDRSSCRAVEEHDQAGGVGRPRHGLGNLRIRRSAGACRTAIRTAKPTRRHRRCQTAADRLTRYAVARPAIRDVLLILGLTRAIGWQAADTAPARKSAGAPSRPKSARRARSATPPCRPRVRVRPAAGGRSD